MARYGRVELLNQQLRAWIGDDISRVSDEKLVVISALFDIPNMEAMSSALGKKAASIVAAAAMAIIETD
jgi:hypothetical protein